MFSAADRAWQRAADRALQRRAESLAGSALRMPRGAAESLRGSGLRAAFAAVCA